MLFRHPLNQLNHDFFICQEVFWFPGGESESMNGIPLDDFG
jgi:hypothetical protein